MKECPHCTARMFDDQDFCFECMQSTICSQDGIAACSTNEGQMICFEVLVGNNLKYETRLRKIEGALLRVGSACENTIVIPELGISEHQLDIFFSQGLLWAEDKGSISCVELNGMPLESPRSMQLGACLSVGTARLNLISA